VKRERYHHGDLRLALVGEALKLVEERGVAGLTLREVARRAGVSEAAPYRHFASKDALVAAVAEDGFQSMLARVRRALAGASADPAERLEAVGAAYVRFAVERPAHFRVMFGRDVAESHGFKGLWDAGQANFEALLHEIAAAQKAGLVAGRDRRPAARALWSALHGLAFLLVDGLLARQGLGPRGRNGVEALARQVTRALLEGLRVPKPQRGPRGARAGDVRSSRR